MAVFLPDMAGIPPLLSLSSLIIPAMSGNTLYRLKGDFKGVDIETGSCIMGKLLVEIRVVAGPAACPFFPGGIGGKPSYSPDLYQ